MSHRPLEQLRLRVVKWSEGALTKASVEDDEIGSQAMCLLVDCYSQLLLSQRCDLPAACLAFTDRSAINSYRGLHYDIRRSALVKWPGRGIQLSERVSQNWLRDCLLVALRKPYIRWRSSFMSIPWPACTMKDEKACVHPLDIYSISTNLLLHRVVKSNHRAMLPRVMSLAPR